MHPAHTRNLLSKHVDEEDVGGDVLPVVVHEGACDELPPLGCSVVQVQHGHVTGAQDLVDHKHGQIDNEESKYAVVRGLGGNLCTCCALRYE